MTWLGVLVTIGRALIPLIGVFFAGEALGSILNHVTRIKEGNESVDWRAKIEFPGRIVRIIAGAILALGISPSIFLGIGLILFLEACVAVGLRLQDVEIRTDEGKLPKVRGYGGNLRMKFRFVRGLLGLTLLEVGHFI